MWQNQELWSLAQDHLSAISSKFRHSLIEAGEAFLDSESKQNLQASPLKKMKHKLHTVATAGTSAGNRNLSSRTVHRDRGNTAFFSGHPCLGRLFGHTATSESPMLCQSLQQAPSSLSWVWNCFFGLPWEPYLAWTDVNSHLRWKGHTTVILGTCCIILWS